MKELLSQYSYLGLVLSIGAYCFGEWLKKRTKAAWCNSLLIACILVVVFLLAAGMDYEVYQKGTGILTQLLTPATVCLAVPLYRQFRLLRGNALAIAAGILSGIAATFACVLALGALFALDHTQYVTLLPKSVTTAIGMALSEEMGGLVSVTVAAILITGILGDLTAPWVLKLLRIRHPIAKGVAIGASSHVIGTTRAFELGELEGAMSGLATVVSGLLTVFLIPAVSGIF